MSNPIRKMSLYDGTLDRKVAAQLIEETRKPIRYTYGFAWKNPTTLRVPISKNRALEIVEKGLYTMDFVEYEDYIHINEFSGSDMW